MRAYVINQDTKTIHDAVENKILYFGYRDFYEKIVKEGCCFICGAESDSKEFNYEHIIPDWILRSFGLHHEEMRLHNESLIWYSKYKIPCCKECNSVLASTYELPVSQILKKPYNDLKYEIDQNEESSRIIFQWMCVIFFKTHLKDMQLRMQLDTRVDKGRIGEYYDWREMHHIHCMARAHYTKAKIDLSAYGSLLIFRVLKKHEEDNFDYMDNLASQAVLIQVGNYCIISVLNDSGICYEALSSTLSKISGPLTSFQLKEVFARLVSASINLKTRPIFYSSIESGYAIKSTVPEKIEFNSEMDPTAGELLWHYVKDLIPAEAPEREIVLEQIKACKRSYLFNEQGEFVQFASVPLE